MPDLEPSSDTVLRELPTGFEIEHESGKLQVHELAPGVILQEYEAGVVDEYLEPVVELAQRRIGEGVRVTLVSDITRSRSHTTSYRRAWSDWIIEHAEHLDEVLVLLSSPMQRMAVNAASVATGGGMFRAFTDVEAFQAAVEQAVLRAELAAQKIERLTPVIQRTGTDVSGGGSGSGGERVATVALAGTGTLDDSDFAEPARVRGGHKRRLASAEPQVGTVLADAYRLDQRIGKGGMGTVYRARQLSLERDVAVKLIRLDRRHTPGTFARFRREIDVVSRLSHPNIVQVIDAGSTDAGISYLVMELLAGQRLDHFIAEHEDHPGLEPALAVELFRQLCAGVGAAHAVGLVHRDLTPANVFVRRLDDGARQIKILDFGLAKGPEQGEASLTLDGQILGTPGFMAPEQIDNERPADARTDVYALGVLLYTMLSGRRPFVGKSTAAIIAHQLEGRYAPLDDEHRRFADIVDRALARDPDERYESVVALWTAVREADRAPDERAGVGPAAGTLGSGSPAVAVTDGRGWTRTRELLWVVALALLLAGVLVGVSVQSCAALR